MTDDWLTRNRPGAFQDPSFGHKDGWFLAIQMAMLFATITSALAVLPPLSHAASIGGGLSRNAAIGVLVYGFWLFGLMGFKRWAIRALPAIACLLLAGGLLIAAIPLVLPPPLLPGDAPPIAWFSRIAGLTSATLSALALWRMRTPVFKAYHAAAQGRAQ